MTRCRVDQDELDYDTQQGQWEPVKSIFDYENDVDWRVDTEHATTLKPDAFELELAKEEQERKMQQLEQAVNDVMNRGY